ncbi:MAG: hypothetical protein N3E48_02645 [Candidatus Bathyarchaeota archaeon]|nr:hypothetical protein [Candidatus Bathyarchaeota archaeon]
MIYSYDVGSLPLEEDYKKFLAEASKLGTYFKAKVVGAFIDKVKVGVDIPNYPQFRDMNEMFLEMIDGLVKIDGEFLAEGSLKIKGDGFIPEVKVLKDNLKEIYEKVNFKVEVKLCVTGPYTLSYVFKHRNPELFLQLANVLGEIVEINIFNLKEGAVKIVSLDEPLFAVVDDPQIDYGSEGREALVKAWEKIFYKACSRNVKTALHLHSTRDELYFTVENLKIIETHVEDSFYFSKHAKDMVERNDKFIKASISITDFDKLLQQNLEKQYPGKCRDFILKEIGEIWSKIRGGKVDPRRFLEDKEILRKRLKKIVEFFGVERVPYAGAECGLRGFPNYNVALKCLEDVSNVVRCFRKTCT